MTAEHGFYDRAVERRRWLTILAGSLLLWPEAAPSEFRFPRLEYKDPGGTRRGFGRGWWRQDWPEGDGHHLPLTDDRIFDYPRIYAAQVGDWDLRDAETARLRAYLERGGFW